MGSDSEEEDEDEDEEEDEEERIQKELARVRNMPNQSVVDNRVARREANKAARQQEGGVVGADVPEAMDVDTVEPTAGSSAALRSSQGQLLTTDTEMSANASQRFLSTTDSDMSGPTSGLSSDSQRRKRKAEETLGKQLARVTMEDRETPASSSEGAASSSRASLASRMRGKRSVAGGLPPLAKIDYASTVKDGKKKRC